MNWSYHTYNILLQVKYPFINSVQFVKNKQKFKFAILLECENITKTN